MKWTILFLVLCGVGVVFLADQMPFAIGDDPQRGSGEAFDPDGNSAAEDPPEEFEGESGGFESIGNGPDEDSFNEAAGTDGEDLETEERLTEVVRLKKLEAKRALEVLKRIGGQRHLSMGVDEETNVLILSGHQENVELATEILRSLENGRLDEARRFVEGLEDDPEREEASGEDAFDLAKGPDQDFEFWIGFPRNEDVEDLLARRMEELESVENQAAETQAVFAQAIARRRANRNDREAEKTQRQLQQRLSEVVAKAFELRQQVQRLQVYRLRSRLADVTQKMNQREQLRKRIISQRINQMTQEAERTAMEHLDAIRDTLPEESTTARPIDFDSYVEMEKEPGPDPLTMATVRVTWSFTEDFGRRVRQIHASGTICGESPGGSTLIVTVAPEMPEEEPTSIRVRPGAMRNATQTGRDAQVVAFDREKKLMLLTTSLSVQKPLPFETSVKAGLAIRATWVGGDAGTWHDSAGVIAATGRRVRTRNLIQHDIATPAEAAGGPIVNRKGRIIGLLSPIAPGKGINMAVPAGDVAQFIADWMEAGVPYVGLVEGEEPGGASGHSKPDGDLPLAILEVRRELVDAEHTLKAAEKDYNRMKELTLRASNIIPHSELDKGLLKFQRAKDMFEATRQIYEARIRLLEQDQRRNDASYEKAMNEFRRVSQEAESNPKDAVLKSYLEDIREQLFDLRAVRERQNTLLDSLRGTDEVDSGGEATGGEAAGTGLEEGTEAAGESTRPDSARATESGAEESGEDGTTEFGAESTSTEAGVGEAGTEAAKDAEELVR